MKTITEKIENLTSEQYRKITNCSTSFHMGLDFTIDEIQTFLRRLGYEIYLHEGWAMVQDYESDGGGGMDKVGDKYKAIRMNIFAVKSVDELGDRLDTEEMYGKVMTSVFRREILNRILGV